MPGELALRRAVRDAHDPAVGAAVAEEAVHRVGQVRVGRVAERLEELVPVRQPRRLVHRPLLREADEAGDARVRDRRAAAAPPSRSSDRCRVLSDLRTVACA